MRKLYLSFSAMALIVLAACASSSTTTPAGTLDQTLAAQFVAGGNAAAILAQTGGGLETTCVLKPGSPAQVGANTAFVSIAAGLNGGNAVIQAAMAQTPPGDMSLATVDLKVATDAIQALQAQMAALPVPAPVVAQMLAQTHRAASSSMSTLGPIIINLIVQNLPLIISEASQLAGVIKGWISGLSGGADTLLTAASVQQAVGNLNSGIAIWTASAKTVCK